MAEIPAITGEQMAEIDRVMMEEIGVNTWQLMELAGFAIADAARRCHPRSVIALAGTGGNGGDAMVAARLLTGWGIPCTVYLTRAGADYTGAAAHQLAILNRLNIPVRAPSSDHLPAVDLIIDGLLGFSTRGNPRGEAARLIGLANEHEAPILAIDLPSGLQADTGTVGTPCIRASQTVTLALPKTGLLAADPAITGEIWAADIGVPPQVYQRFGVDVPPQLFAERALIRVR